MHGAWHGYVVHTCVEPEWCLQNFCECTEHHENKLDKLSFLAKGNSSAEYSSEGVPATAAVKILQRGNILKQLAPVVRALCEWSCANLYYSTSVSSEDRGRQRIM